MPKLYNRFLKQYSNIYMIFSIISKAIAKALFKVSFINTIVSTPLSNKVLTHQCFDIFLIIFFDCE